MNKTKKHKGITLIALIITIVVLLILAVTTIGAVKDRGIIFHAQNATSNYTIEQEKERIGLALSEWQIQNAIPGNTTLFKGVISNTLSGQECKIEGNDNGPLTITFNKTGNVYTVTKDGEITSVPPIIEGELSDIDEFKKYTFGADGEGRNINDIFDLSTLTLKQDSSDSTSTIHEKVKVAYIDNETLTVYSRYKRDVYKFNFTVNASTQMPEITVKDSLVLVNSPEGNLGKYVRYQGIDWIVLNEDSQKVELISANGLGELTFENPTSNYEIGRTNYNDAVEIIVNKCKEETGITSNIRSVGGPASEDALSFTNTVDFSEIPTTVFTPQVEDSRFAQFEGATNGLRKEDENYKADYEQMVALGILLTDTPSDYWFASRCLKNSGGSDFLHFFVRYLRRNGAWGERSLCYVERYASGGGQGNRGPSSVRPVINISAKLINEAAQSGFIDDPIILD